MIPSASDHLPDKKNYRTRYPYSPFAPCDVHTSIDVNCSQCPGPLVVRTSLYASQRSTPINTKSTSILEPISTPRSTETRLISREKTR